MQHKEDSVQTLKRCIWPENRGLNGVKRLLKQGFEAEKKLLNSLFPVPCSAVLLLPQALHDCNPA